MKKVAVFSLEIVTKKFYSRWIDWCQLRLSISECQIVILLTLFPIRRGSFTFEICVRGGQAILKGKSQNILLLYLSGVCADYFFGITNWKIRKLKLNLINAKLNQLQGAASFPQEHHTVPASCTSPNTFHEEAWILQGEHSCLLHGHP